MLQVPGIAPARAGATIVLALLATASIANQGFRANAGAPGAAADPGVRAGTVDAGAPLPGLTTAQTAYFASGKANFMEIASVKGLLPGQTDEGLGPRFNSNSCASCHAQPAIGGSSPSTSAFPFIGPNPQVAVATLSGAVNQVPYFITADGPVREARFPLAVDTSGQLTNQLDGGVHDLFVITGRTDAMNTAGASGQLQSCKLLQPPFDQMRRLGNIAFRIPTPLFGAGLIEAIPDENIVQNLTTNAAQKQAFGISGRVNRSGNDGTVTRFGWKAQNASLMMFSGEAYNVEQGVSNELFTQERASPGEQLPPECIYNQVPEDTTHFDTPNDLLSDIQAFATFAKLLAPPAPSSTVPGGADSIQRGEALFTNQIGCALCHTPALKSVASTYTPALGPTSANLFSDLALHDMGPTLADGISQGLATSREFRTAPLWGLGQRVFFMHDGRTSDLVQAILLHGDNQGEGRISVEQYQRLSAGSQQDVLNFLRSL